MGRIRTVGLVVKRDRPRAVRLAARIVSRAAPATASRVLADAEALAARRCPRARRTTLARECDLIVVLGGDGTLLSIARHAGARARSSASTWASSASSPRSTETEAMPMLARVLAGRYELDRRMTLVGRARARRPVAPALPRAERRRHHERRARAHRPLRGVGRRAAARDLPRRRPHRRDADGIDGLLAVGRRPDRRADGAGAAAVADLAAHAVEPAGRAAARGGRAHRDRRGASRTRSSRSTVRKASPLAGGDVIVVRRAPAGGVAGALARSHATTTCCAPSSAGARVREASMLRTLRVTDLAIIDEIELVFEPGFNVLTGETGAGKSILLQALDVALGGRPDADLVRSGRRGGGGRGALHGRHGLGMGLARGRGDPARRRRRAGDPPRDRGAAAGAAPT